MAVALTPQNKQTLKRLLKTGRWNNESEVLRYGLHLVDEEARAKAARELTPYTDAELRKALKAETQADQTEQRRIGRHSARPKSTKDLD